METYEIDRKEIEELNPVAEGYKAIQWDSGTKKEFRYGDTGENLIGKVFKVDGDIEECKWGFHFSTDPAYVFNFYEPLGYNRYFKVKAYDKVIHSKDGFKSVSNVIEFVEEYNLIEFIWIIKKHDRKIIRSNAVRKSNAVSCSNAVRKSNAVSSSNAVSDSNAVSYSDAVSWSDAVSNSDAVRWSNAVNCSNAVRKSNSVSWSNAVSNSNAVSSSNAVSNSNAVRYSNAVSNSKAVSNSDAVICSDAVSCSNAVYNSYGLKQCKGSYNSIFCFNKSGIANYIFNKKSNQERCAEIMKELQEFKWFPEFMNWYEIKGNKEWWSFCFPQLAEIDEKEAWSKMPNKMLEYIKSLPEFNAKVFKEITGINA